MSSPRHPDPIRSVSVLSKLSISVRMGEERKLALHDISLRITACVPVDYRAKFYKKVSGGSREIS